MGTGEDLLLLAVDDRHARTRGGVRLAAALAAAHLVDLAAAERITLDGTRLRVTRIEPVGDELLDPAVAAIAKSTSPVTVHRWLTGHAHPAVIARYATAARAAGTVKTDETLSYDRDKARVRRSEPRINVADESARDQIVARVSAALALPGTVATAPVPVQDVALAVLVDAVGLTKLYLGSRSDRQARARLSELATGKSGGLPDPDRTVMSIARSAHRMLSQWKETDPGPAIEIGPIPMSAQWVIKNAGAVGGV
ncbi:GPP34 family phosphoprotein [Actinospica robiniae]|uniref:GPP34 family phosphoprotein n=1 Tax=Actinospica robiniae TaxID=304901 RepID=UPI000406F133|nr:GPP34 family phosphoprotein [Actinospica robiniae]